MTELLRPSDPGYPERLHHLQRPPNLWVAGRWPKDAPMVAIVGARHPSPYGLRSARRLAASLAESGAVIVSGLALGVDAAAHIGALDAEGCTLAILGTGIDRVHPSSNRALHERIVQTGALVSAYPPGTPVARFRFLERNLLIAAIAHVVIVVEGVHPSSGALSTAARARDLGREVLAVPGPIDSALASGPNRLIRDGCAPCLDPSDVFAALEVSGFDSEGAFAGARVPGVGRAILAAMAPGRDAAGIASVAGLPADRTLDALLDLELRGLIRRDQLGGYALR